MIHLILIRHGHTAWNVDPQEGSAPGGPRFRGTVDVPLSEKGLTQARCTALRLADEPLTAVYSSPLQRAARTAEIVAEPHGLAVESQPGLSSMDYGAWAGLFHAEVADRWPDLYRRWSEDPFSVEIPDAGPPGQTPHIRLHQRAVAAVQQILARHDDGDTVALVSHQAVLRTLVCALAGLANPGYWWIGQGLGNLSRFDYDPASGAFVLAGLNDVCHLAPSLPGDPGRTRLILLRHGQTAWNSPARAPGEPGGPGAGLERFRGRIDLPLDDVGLAQARAVADRLKEEPIAALYASPLGRARQTVAPLAAELGLPVQDHAGLLDIDYGRFQGLTHAEAAEAHPRHYGLWRTAPGQVHFPGGEGLADVQARLHALLDELALRHAGQTVVLVGHQIVNKVLLCTLLDLGDLDQIWRIEQDTACLNVFQQSGGWWHTLSVNDVCHLVKREA
jgi:probable phosphoglycerate mutase